MEKVILLKTQLAEAAEFAKSNRFAHKRLAVILLDNFIEIQLNSLMKQKFEWNVYLQGNLYSTDRKFKIQNRFDELIKACLEEEIITPNEKMLLSFCHKIRNNLYHKGNEEKLLTQVAIIILSNIINEHQNKWKNARMLTSYRRDTIDPYQIGDTPNSSGNSEENWKKFLQKYFVIIDNTDRTSSELISDFLIEKIKDAKEYYEFIQSEFDVFFPNTKDWTFNDFVLHYSFEITKESQLEKIGENPNLTEQKNKIINLQKEYLTKWKIKKVERLDILEKSFENIKNKSIEKSIEKFITYRDETYLYYDSLLKAAQILDDAIENSINIKRGK
jgi:hypothetical protein